MTRALLCLCLLTCILPRSGQAADDMGYLGRWTIAGIDRLLDEKNSFDQPGDQIAVISEAFVDTPYLANSLIGGIEQKEELVVRFDGFDCMTLIESVEALRLARTFRDFNDRLKQVRYKAGTVGYLYRNHFFSDWIVSNATTVQDVTGKLGQDRAQCVDKVLNQPADGRRYLEGVPTEQRTVCYLPSDSIDAMTLAALKTGDYVGFYSAAAGLDVSHTGIAVKRKGRVLLRHASSASGVNKVVDVELFPYLKKHTGLIILRPLSK